MGLKVIGAGYGRTGTQSLKHALEILGQGKCYHMEEMLRHPEGVKHWINAYQNKEVNWNKLFENYQSIVGFPGAIYSQRLADFYPDAKLILTLRNPEEWYESFRSTVASYEMAMHLKLKLQFKKFYSQRAKDLYKVRQINKLAIWKKYFEDKFSDKQYTIEKYKRHFDDIKNKYPKDRLLIFEFPHSWPDLCKFLQLDVPQSPYPRLNKKINFSQFVDGIYRDVLNL